MFYVTILLITVEITFQNYLCYFRKSLTGKYPVRKARLIGHPMIQLKVGCQFNNRMRRGQGVSIEIEGEKMERRNISLNWRPRAIPGTNNENLGGELKTIWRGRAELLAGRPGTASNNRRIKVVHLYAVTYDFVNRILHRYVTIKIPTVM